jgi:hypothetical protein
MIPHGGAASLFLYTFRGRNCRMCLSMQPGTFSNFCHNSIDVDPLLVEREPTCAYPAQVGKVVGYKISKRAVKLFIEEYLKNNKLRGCVPPDLNPIRGLS